MRLALFFPTLILLVSCGAAPPPPAAERTVLVQIAAPTPASPLQLAGEVRARHETDLAFRVGGKLAARLVDAGTEVRAGTPLARLDAADLQLAKQASRAQLAAAESEAATATAERERYAGLLAKKFVSQAAFDARDNAARIATARLDQARAQAAVSGNQVAYGTLVADAAGVVTAVFAEPGQVLAAGQPAVRLARPEEKEVVVAVPEGRLDEVRTAKAFEVSLWALPGVRLAGVLRELSPAADAATRTYAARLRLVDPPAGARLGMTARVTVAGSAAAEIAVPSSAVFDTGSGASVWLIVDGKLKRQPVSVRQFRQDDVLLSGGLAGGETVVVAGVHRLTEGLAVQARMSPGAAR